MDMDKFQEIRKEYDGINSFLHESLPEMENDEAFLLYYLSATLKIWGSNLLYSPVNLFLGHYRLKGKQGNKKQ